jgi:hypothetical protein
MALIRDYELPGTGLVVANAYHVVTKVNIEKRTSDIEGPVDSSRPDGRTANSKQPGKEVYWKAGYIGVISITVWKDAAAREAGSVPLGFLGVNPTDDKYGAHIANDSKSHLVRFFVDMESSDNHITQAYNHLKTTDYYQNATEV